MRMHEIFESTKRLIHTRYSVTRLLDNDWSTPHHDATTPDAFDVAAIRQSNDLFQSTPTTTYNCTLALRSHVSSPFTRSNDKVIVISACSRHFRRRRSSRRRYSWLPSQPPSKSTRHSWAHGRPSREKSSQAPYVSLYLRKDFQSVPRPNRSHN